ncbi:polyprenyl synthetase family protein [Xanthobacter sp.]|uniref:polyprenyl synthetase family protein n=1 Tax=Xanthobacter sp. TaxID=35809 RepID=UPI0025EA3BC5|nr:polyprenyl synthetase family protein [Xanthobacter sp.]
MGQKGGRDRRTEASATAPREALSAAAGGVALAVAAPDIDAMPAPDTALPDFPPRSRDLSYLRAVVDRRLGLLVPPAASHPAVLHAAMRHILLAPGKRLRPLLVMAAAMQLDASEHAVLDFGCALEMIHASSLIIDDLPCMDDAMVRRAQPTTHVKYGEDVAVLAAVALLSRALGVAGAAPGTSDHVRLDAVCILSKAVGSLGLCGGQYDDLRPSPGRSLAATEDVNRRKTGVLFSAAVEIAGRAAAADEAQTGHLRALAGHVGSAYQILDDILDNSGSAAALGKDVGKDTNKATVIASLGAPRARKLLSEHLAGALAASKELGPNKEGQQPLRDFMTAAFGELMGPLAP